MDAEATWNHGPLWVAQMPRQDDNTRAIERVLIANRGEIACRVIATCRTLQIHSIAVYAQEDAESRHVLDADEAICLGSMSSHDGNPFLNIKLLVEVALKAGADAVHPGYGYLSENAQFADAVRAAGLIFIGPTSLAMTTLGDKRQAKEYLSKHAPDSVPLIPGFTGTATGVQLEHLQEQAEKIGFPVMIKASAGGGGRGLRVVRDKSLLGAEFERAQSEAQRSFGLGDCILEKYIDSGKHVEVQIMGDSHGNVISLWERDCSVQRRHQKIIEESPCPWLTQDLRESMCDVAVRIGKLLKYEGAGTVEFILDLATSKFYFLEVNARLQVEHPITEECTGLDLVALQLFVASAGDLSSISRLGKVPQRGHAIECRLCAEDPNREFAPQHGPIRFWKPCATDAVQQVVRFETAIQSGSTVSIHFDSMIAKIVVWAPTRIMAIHNMARILAETACIGVKTNQLFLQACLLHKNFMRPDYTTAFIPTHLDELLTTPYQLKLPAGLLPAIPSLLLRSLSQAPAKTSRRPVFLSIQRSFRNQKFDKTNRPYDIVTTKDAVGMDPLSRPHICLWDFGSKTPGEDIVEVAPLPQDPGNGQTPGLEDAAASIVTREYNALSVSLRKGGLPNTIASPAKLLGLRIRDVNLAIGGKKRVCQAGQIEMSLGNTKILGYVIVTNGQATAAEADTSDSSSVFCHFPLLGYPIEFHCYSPLSYFESQRTLIARDAGEVQGTINAPMPCKVLQILKKEGDQAKAGEVVMIIESMKMEITIPAGKEGRFVPFVKEGEAVNEGAKLCTFE